jgi:hypothetical protein
VTNALEGEARPGSIGYWTKFFSEPTPTQKVIITVVTSTVMGFIVLGIGTQFPKLKTSTLGIMFMIGFALSFVVFAFIGFIPGWIIALILFIGLGYFALRVIT